MKIIKSKSEKPDLYLKQSEIDRIKSAEVFFKELLMQIIENDCNRKYLVSVDNIQSNISGLIDSFHRDNNLHILGDNDYYDKFKNNIEISFKESDIDDLIRDGKEISITWDSSMYKELPLKIKNDIEKNHVLFFYIYSNKETKYNVVDKNDIVGHIYYNRTFRPGRLMYIENEDNGYIRLNDGCVKPEYLSEFDKIAKEFFENNNVDMSKITKPYV